MPSSPKATKEIKASSLAAEPVCKSYVIDLRGLRDNTPACGDTLTLDQILDMIFPDVNRTTSNNSNTGPIGLTSYEVQTIAPYIWDYSLIVRSVTVAVSLLA